MANDIHFRLEAGARHALIGPNGAGKTTFINLITGRLAPSAGRILLGGDDITACHRPFACRRGLGRTFQINTLFNGMSVLENVCLAVGEHQGIGGDKLRLSVPAELCWKMPTRCSSICASRTTLWCR